MAERVSRSVVREKASHAFARVPLEIKLPLFIGALLLAMLLAIGIGAYTESRRVTLQVATDRLNAVTTQLRDLFQQSAVQLRTQAATAARKVDPSLQHYAYEGPNKEQVVSSQLRDSTGKLLASTGSWTTAVDTATLHALTGMKATDSVALGGFRAANDSIVYPVIARIPGPARNYLVYWRKLGGSRRTREQITKLVGSDASVFLGTPATGRWTDLEGIVPPPTIDKARPGYLTSAQDIAGTPWRIAVEFPVGPVLAPVHAFGRRIIGISILVLLLAFAGTWGASRNILRSLETRIEQRTLELNHVLDELRDAQESLVRKEKLAMLGQLASGVGHELRNPLGVMTNSVYFLRMVLNPPPSPQVTEYLDILQQQITLSEKIVGDLLDFARLKQPQRKATSVAEVTKTQLGRLGSTNGVDVDMEIPENTPRVMVDDVQVGQVVFNLLTNAVQAIDGKGRIVIRAHAENGHVRYDVADSGPGITQENLNKIFEPLFTTKARGIGLGLAVSRTLARANEGDLTVTSVPGQGATFHLTLPVANGSSGGAVERSS